MEKDIQRKKDSLQQLELKQLDVPMQKINEPWPTTHTKIDSKWIIIWM